MNVALQNITKQIKIKNSIENIKNIIPFIGKQCEYFRELDSSRENFNKYTFYFKKPVNTDFLFFNAGVRVDVILDSNENETVITIEIKENFGSTSNENDVTSANIIIDELENAFYDLAFETPESINNKRKIEKNKIKTKDWRIWNIYIPILFGSFGIHHFHNKENLKGILCIIFCWTFIPAIFGVFTGLKNIFKLIFNK